MSIYNPEKAIRKPFRNYNFGSIKFGNMKEEWKPIPGYEGLYEVSNYGRVKSLNKSYKICNKSIYNRKESILKQKQSRIYKCVELNSNGKSKYFQVHRLVAIAFIQNIQNKPYIDHIDGNPLNNHVENLRWVTQKENMNNPITKQRLRNAPRKQGIEHPQYEGKSRCSKMVVKYDLETKKELETYDSIHQASRRNNISATHISAVCLGKRLSAGGYIWKHKL